VEAVGTETIDRGGTLADIISALLGSKINKQFLK
jgi:hypothetical protein